MPICLSSTYRRSLPSSSVSRTQVRLATRSVDAQCRNTPVSIGFTMSTRSSDKLNLHELSAPRELDNRQPRAGIATGLRRSGPHDAGPEHLGRNYRPAAYFSSQVLLDYFKVRGFRHCPFTSLPQLRFPIWFRLNFFRGTPLAECQSRSFLKAITATTRPTKPTAEAIVTSSKFVSRKFLTDSPKRVIRKPDCQESPVPFRRWTQVRSAAGPC